MDRISALMDGELDEGQARREIGRLREDAELRERWESFHLIGDAMRGERLLSPAMMQRLAERLAHEPIVLAPRRGTARKIAAYALSAAASISAVALVGWVALGTNDVGTAREVVRAPAPTLVVPVPAPAPQVANVPNDGNMNEYILAHQGFSPSTALQGVVPYIRSVSSRQPAHNR
ncbi:MAG: sigma-E factor negative regulatory protein [Betaproteobacteria bacterium]|nr:sigma-E factor negative regulatory protein [Betaproteobacteria bacterium]